MPKATIIDLGSNDLKKSVFLSHPTVYMSSVKPMQIIFLKAHFKSQIPNIFYGISSYRLDKSKWYWYCEGVSTVMWDQMIQVQTLSQHCTCWLSGIILCMCPANERRRYNITSSLICWVHSPNGPWTVDNFPLNSWRPSSIWHYWTWSTLVEVMACCLSAPSHHLDQCWLIINAVLWHSPEGNFTRNA